jgi:hypothetical protein
MIALLYFLVTLFASPLKSRSRLEAENAALRYQLIVLRRKVAAAQRLVIPAATVRIDRLRGPFRARLLLGHTFWRRLNVGRYERKRDH